MEIIQSIQNRIYSIRGVRVMLDFDLALLYDVETRILNQAVKRNIDRFPEDFMFQLSEDEWVLIYNQIQSMSSQFVMTSINKRPKTAFPYAFTEQGVAMLSGVLRSEKAIQMNIAIMRAFVAIRKIVMLELDLKEQVKEVKAQLKEHDIQLNQIYDALENLLDEHAAKRKWEERERIGFKK